MKAFKHVDPTSLENAISFLSEDREEALLIAGGTDLVPEMRDRIVSPGRVVNLKAIPDLDRIDHDEKEGFRLGPLVTLTRLEETPRIRETLPVLSEAAASAASPQIRNQGTLGGNLCQRPRCPYFRDPALACFRRGGTICYSLKGENRFHAIFGGGPCHIVHPSDTAPALIALQATAAILGPKGSREVPLEELFCLPEADPTRENVLGPDEILSEIRCPAPSPGSGSAYEKASQRGAWDFALVSAAVLLSLEGKICREARICLGGVAPKPWRVPKAEELLKGQEITEEVAAAAGKKALQGADPMSSNAYKVSLGESIVKRAILRAAI